jgi:aspartyl-tRNA(Asn)/glutamyl-tRNA(Gln) amidotransferase subunit C
MEKLTDEEVLKVLKLSKLDPNIEDIEKLKYQLKDILNEIDKIEKLDIDEQEILISPSKNKNVYSDDKIGIMLDKKDVLKNALSHDETYIEVVGVFND